jgi:hypothetical protein
MALLNADDRHPDTQEAAARFEIDHILNPDERQVGMAHARLAQEMLQRIRKDGPELTKALHGLADVRDTFMHAIASTKRNVVGS